MKTNNQFPVVVVNNKSLYVIDKEDAKEYPREIIELCAPYSDYTNKLERDYKSLKEQRDILVDNHNETVKSYKSEIKILEQKLNSLVEENKEIKITKNAIMTEYISVCNVIAYNLIFGHNIDYNIFNNPPSITFSCNSCSVISTFSDRDIICESEEIAKEVIKKLHSGDILFVDAIREYAINQVNFPEIFKDGI